jgi:hypothetical protein
VIRLSVPVCAALCAAAPLLAQNSTGSIAGAVRDPSDAVVASAKITARNEETGLTRVAETSAEGIYRIPLLPAGSYSVKVEKQGFKSQVQTGVRIEILQVRGVEFRLELGSVSDTVTVETRAPLLETETSQAGEVIKGEQVVSLPLSARQFLQLGFLTPMVTPATNDFRSNEVNRESAMPAAAGQRPEQNNYQIDGVDNRESGRNSLAVGASVEAIAEFRVQTGLAPAEFGRGGGAIINAATKAGTNAFHGSLYEFLRNDKFDSRPFFANRVNPLKRNQFGGALGGPVKTDKVFFFGNYEGFRESASGNPPVGRVFTADERRGVFGSTLTVDPLANRAPFPNNNVPAARFDPISVRILQLVPEPNNPADPQRNFVFNGVPPGSTNRDYAVGRVDWNASERNTVSSRYLYNKENLRTSPGLPPPANSGGRDFVLRAQSVNLNWNRVVKPNLINSVNLGYTRYRNRLGTLNSFVKDYITPAGITNTLSAVDPLFWAAPSVSVPGYAFPSEITPNYRTTNNFQIQENLLMTRGAHTIKAGADLREIRTYMFYTGGNGSTAFANRYSNNPAADYMLGFVSSANKTARATQWNSTIRYGGFFLQDDWKVHRKLTLNLGVRYEVESALKQIDNGGLGFHVADRTMLVSKHATNLGTIQEFYRTIRTDIPIRVVDNRAPYDADTNNIGPRVGFAYSAGKNLVVRGGYGIYFDAPQIQSLASTNDFAPNTLRPIWTANPTVPDIGYNPEGRTSAEASLRTAPLTIFPFISRKFPYAKIQQWNLSVQRQFGQSFVVEGMYQGSSGVNLLGFDNINFRAPGPGNVQQLLPFPQFARIQNEDMWGQSNFHGFGLKLEQRPVHGVTYLIAYTWGKSIDNASTFNQGPQWTDPFNRRSGRGVSDFNAPHRFSAAYELRLPFGRNLSGAAKVLSHGWGVRGLTFFQTGLPQNPSMNLARTGICAAACSARPDRIGDGNLPKGTRSLSRFYDVTAFRVIAAGGADRRVGNGGRNVLVSAGINNWDLQVFKDFRIREGHNLEFRWESFNAFNHTQWGGAATNMEAPEQFGIISGTRAPRIMQFVLRYSF